MNKGSKIYIAGHKGMVGSAIVRNLRSRGYTQFIFSPRSEYDLINQGTVNEFFEKEQPEYVINAAAKVGGILANDAYRGDFIYENLMIQSNILHAAHVHNVKKLLFLGSSCIYPKMSPQPIKEEYLMTGELEPTNSPYAVAKIAGIEMCWSYNKQYGTQYIPVMPTNLYGINDNFNLKTSHVLPAMIRRFHEAKSSDANSVTIWGTGKPKREFLHVDDLAEACVHLLNMADDKIAFKNSPLFNIGAGADISINSLAQMVGRIIGFKGEIVHDLDKPDGTPQKLLDSSRINKLGWKSLIGLEDGVRQVYDWYKQSLEQK